LTGTSADLARRGSADGKFVRKMDWKDASLEIQGTDMRRAALEAFLDTANISYVTAEHPAVFRVGEDNDISAALPGAHTKNLFLKDKKGKLFLISAVQDTVIDLKTLHKTIGSDRLSFGNPQLMLQTLGVTPGSVTALALWQRQDMELQFILDLALLQADQVNFHPLINTATTTMTRDGFIQFLNLVGVVPRVVDFSQNFEISSVWSSSRL
jgi:Ala-tRNA(Pro) deacylase